MIYPEYSLIWIKAVLGYYPIPSYIPDSECTEGVILQIPQLLGNHDK